MLLSTIVYSAVFVFRVVDMLKLGNSSSVRILYTSKSNHIIPSIHNIFTMMPGCDKTFSPRYWRRDCIPFPLRVLISVELLLRNCYQQKCSAIWITSSSHWHHSVKTEQPVYVWWIKINDIILIYELYILPFTNFLLFSTILSRTPFGFLLLSLRFIIIYPLCIISILILQHEVLPRCTVIYSNIFHILYTIMFFFFFFVTRSK
jgi:hypothetical protein